LGEAANVAVMLRIEEGKSMRRLFLAVFVVFLHSILFNPAVSADTVHFRTEITNDEISVGQQSVIKIYAWAEDAVSGNGIVSWGLDVMLDASEDGIVAITEDQVLEPYSGFYMSKGALSLNSPYSGAATTEGAFGMADSSDLGVCDGQVENYTLMADITVQAVAAGTISYELGSYSTPIEDNFYATLADDTKLTGTFEDTISQTEITVVPEPASILMLSLFSGLAAIKSKH
jgi:hypothetical protein